MKRKNRKQKKNNKFTAFFKNCGLLIRCLFASVSFSVLWIGIATYGTTYGIWLIIVGALASLLAVFANIVVPLIKLK